MKFSRHLLASIALFAFAGLAQAQSTVPAYYSFADLFRLSVAGSAADYAAAPAPAGTQPVAQLSEYQLRLASTASQGASAAASFAIAAPQPVAAGFAYSSSVLPQPSRWLLILSGLAVAAWVARRRLGYSL